MPTTRTAVTLTNSERLLHRTAEEHRRLTIQRDAINHELAKRTDTLRHLLVKHKETRLKLGGLEIRRSGPKDIVVDVIDRKALAATLTITP